MLSPRAHQVTGYARGLNIGVTELKKGVSQRSGPGRGGTGNLGYPHDRWTGAGRYLLVVLTEAMDGRDYEVTVRDRCLAPDLRTQGKVKQMSKQDERVIATVAQSYGAVNPN
jgi:hypothetical protein